MNTADRLRSSISRNGVLIWCIVEIFVPALSRFIRWQAFPKPSIGGRENSFTFLHPRTFGMLMMSVLHLDDLRLLTVVRATQQTHSSWCGKKVTFDGRLGSDTDHLTDRSYPSIRCKSEHALISMDSRHRLQSTLTLKMFRAMNSIQSASQNDSLQDNRCYRPLAVGTSLLLASECQIVYNKHDSAIVYMKCHQKKTRNFQTNACP